MVHCTLPGHLKLVLDYNKKFQNVTFKVLKLMTQKYRTDNILARNTPPSKELPRGLPYRGPSPLAVKAIYYVPVPVHQQPKGLLDSEVTTK